MICVEKGLSKNFIQKKARGNFSQKPFWVLIELLIGRNKKMTHLHITTWVIAIILFFVAVVLTKNKNEKPAKIVSMILRLFYLFIIGSGIQLYLLVDPSSGYHIKALLGILVIVFMELVLAGIKRGKSTTIYWVLWFLILVATIYMGFTLPL